jgi:AbrB family looped-hinge helix DNA binding protein
MKVTIKGQVTIPLDIREKLGITPETEVDFLQEGDRVFIVKRKGKAGAVRRKFSKLRGVATVKMTTDEIMALTRSDE